MTVLVTGAPGTRLDAIAAAVAALVPPSELVATPAVAAVDAGLLERLGWSSTALPARPSPDARPDAAALEAARAHLADAVAPAPAPGAAHPATGILLPWWRRLLDDRLVVVVAVDDPEAAAWRAALADDGEPELALAGWLAWHRHLAAGAAGLPLVLVDPGAFAEAGSPAVGDLAAALRDLGVALAGTPGPSAEPAPAVSPAPPPDPARAALAGPARELVAAWRPSAVSVHTAAALVAPDAEPWEVALLALGQRLAATRALRAAEGTALADARSRAAAAADLDADLALAQERMAELDGRLAAAAEDAAATVDRLAALSAEAAAQRARADELAGTDLARRAELTAALERERVLALEHLRRGASPVGRLAGRWAQLGDRVGAVRAADRAADVALQVATLRRPRMLRPHPLFDAAWYVAQNDDIRESGSDPYRHYRRHGSREGRRPNPWLDPDWYRSRYPDVRDSGADPIDHYHEHGWREGRDPGPDFDSGWYLRAYPDVLVSGIDPLEHYLAHGRSEGRSPRPPDGDRRALGSGWIAGPASGLPDPGARVAQAPAAHGQGEGGQAIVDRRSTRGWLVDITAALDALPAGSRALLVADRGDAPPAVPGRAATWLAPAGDGSAGGCLPASDRSAIVRLENARWAGADHLVLHRDQAWWLERSPELGGHLERYRRVPLGGVPASAWRLAPVSRPADDGTDALLARIRRTIGRDLVTLAWGVPGQPLTERLGGTVFEPPAATDALPYLDGTIDIVAIPGDEPDRLAEARRVATAAVLRVVGRRGDLEPAWLSPTLATPARVAVALVGGPGRVAGDADVARLADSLLDAPADELVVAAPAGASPALPSGPGAPRARHLPVEPEASVLARALAAAHATSAELIAILDGTALPLPGWLAPLAAALETDAAIDAAMPVLATPDGLLADGDGRDAGDARARVVRTVASASPAVLVVRRADLLALDLASPAPAGLTTVDGGHTFDFGRAGLVEPAALAVLAREGGRS